MLTFIISKAIGSIIFGGISACISWIFLRMTVGISHGSLYDFGLAKEEAWDITIGEWNKEIQKYKDVDVGEWVADVFKTEESEKTSTNRISKVKYYSDVKREYGPFTIKVWEIIGYQTCNVFLCFWCHSINR